MSKPIIYLRNFETRQEHDAVYGQAGYAEPWVAHTDSDDSVSYNIPDIEKYFTVTPLEDGFRLYLPAGNFSYSVNYGEWKTTTGEDYIEDECKTGDTIRLKCVTNNFDESNLYSNDNKRFNVSGNVMSLLYGDNFIGQTNMTGKSLSFLLEDTKVVDASNLILPATTLASYCYNSMFYGCTSLETAPSILPATTLVDYCYRNMFRACTSLTTAPELPATTLAQACYENMFYGCTSLETAPSILPATTLVDYCYRNMFRACTSLTTAPVLPATTLYSCCYECMFFGCSSLNYIKAMALDDLCAGYATTDWVDGVAATGTFVKNGEATWNCTGTDGIPAGWTVQYDPPAPAPSMMTMIVDDFPADYVEEGEIDFDGYLADPFHNGGQTYTYTGDTITYNGSTAYVWQGNHYLENRHYGSTPFDDNSNYYLYVITSTNDLAALQAGSLVVLNDGNTGDPILETPLLLCTMNEDFEVSYDANSTSHPNCIVEVIEGDYEYDD